MDLPREKLLNTSPKMLKNYELLAIILNTGTKNLSVLKLARKVEMILKMYNYKSKNIKKHLQEIKGLGPAKISKLLAVLELANRIQKQRLKQLIKPEDIFKMFLHLTKAKQEKFYIIGLNSQYLYISHKLIYKGTRNLVQISLNDIFSYLFKINSPNFILIHNHPSGELYPSKTDIITTKQIFYIAELLGLNLVDHLIITSKGQYFSFRRNNLIPASNERY